MLKKKRPIIVKLAHFKTKDTILACGPKLKDTSYAIREDFAFATRLARSKLIQFIRPKKCAFKLNVDKLHVGHKCYVYDPVSDSVIESAKQPAGRAQSEHLSYKPSQSTD